jgi:hypothetical protein
MSRRPEKTLTGWMIRKDNAYSHNSRLSQEAIKSSRRTVAAAGLYRVNIAPSDFVLFGHLKGTMSDMNYPSQAELMKTFADSFK